jgi:hypothetical protein
LILSYRGGVLPVANGGTGASTLTSNAVLLGNGTGRRRSDDDDEEDMTPIIIIGLIIAAINDNWS